MNKKILTMMLAVVLLLTACIAGTLAWLTDTSDEVVNTFTVGNIDITLTESDADGDKVDNTNSYKMIPGNVIAKDPKVTVKAKSEDCWVFVKIVESTNPRFSDYMTYDVADGWTALSGQTGVYYREVGASKDDQKFYVLAGNTENRNGIVTVKDTVTKEMMDALQSAYAVEQNVEGSDATASNKAFPQLTITAYAVQKANVADAATAWGILFPPATT